MLGHSQEIGLTIKFSRKPQMQGRASGMCSHSQHLC